MIPKLTDQQVNQILELCISFENNILKFRSSTYPFNSKFVILDCRVAHNKLVFKLLCRGKIIETKFKLIETQLLYIKLKLL